MTRRVLLFEDDDAIREVATASLELVGGWEVISAASGDGAVALAVSHEPDVVLTDLRMPGTDGPTAAANLKRDPATATIPVIVLTARASAADQDEWGDLPVAGVITKPFDPLTLPELVGDILGWNAVQVTCRGMWPETSSSMDQPG